MKRGLNNQVKSGIFHYNFFLKNRKGQIWIETVIYTLIIMVLIGVVLSYANPKIESFRDKISIERTMNFLMALDNTMNDIQNVPGNKRVIDFTLSDGEMRIDGIENRIIFEIQSRYQYSEEGETFTENGFSINTESQGKYKKVNISKTYQYNLTYAGSDQLKTISKASTPYKISISNNGFSGNVTIMDISIN